MTASGCPRRWLPTDGGWLPGCPRRWLPGCPRRWLPTNLVVVSAHTMHFGPPVCAPWPFAASECCPLAAVINRRRSAVRALSLSRPARAFMQALTPSVGRPGPSDPGHLAECSRRRPQTLRRHGPRAPLGQAIRPGKPAKRPPRGWMPRPRGQNRSSRACPSPARPRCTFQLGGTHEQARGRAR